MERLGGGGGEEERDNFWRIQSQFLVFSFQIVISVSTRLESWGVPQISFCIVSLFLFFCDFVTVIDNSLSFTDCLPPDEEALASKACGKKYISNSIESFSNCPKQQKTRPIDKYQYLALLCVLQQISKKKNPFLKSQNKYKKSSQTRSQLKSQVTIANLRRDGALGIAVQNVCQIFAHKDISISEIHEQIKKMPQHHFWLALFQLEFLYLYGRQLDFVTHKLRILTLVGAHFLRIFLFGENVIKFVSSVFANKREPKKNLVDPALILNFDNDDYGDDKDLPVLLAHAVIDLPNGRVRLRAWTSHQRANLVKAAKEQFLKCC